MIIGLLGQFQSKLKVREADLGILTGLQDFQEGQEADLDRINEIH